VTTCFPQYHKDCFWLFYHTATATDHSPKYLQTRVSVTLGFAGADAAGLWQASLAGIPQYLLQQLQSVVNSAARLVFSLLRYDHVTLLQRSAVRRF